MQTLQLDNDNNIVFVRGEPVVIDGIDACAQDTKNRIGIVRGGNPLDTSQGADFYNKLLGKMGGVEYIRESIRERILDNDEITGIRTMETKFENETLTITANIDTIYGDFEL